MARYNIIENQYGRWDAFLIQDNNTTKVARAQNHTLSTVLNVLMKNSQTLDIKIIQYQKATGIAR